MIEIETKKGIKRGVVVKEDNRFIIVKLEDGNYLKIKKDERKEN